MAWSVTSKVGWLALTWASSMLPLSRAASKVFFLNGRTGCQLKLSGEVEQGSGDVTVLVPAETGGRANPGSGS
jgi:hypothetical protein